MELNLLKEVEAVSAHYERSTWPDDIELIKITDSPLIKEDAQRQLKQAKRRMIIRRFIITTLRFIPVFLSYVFIRNWLDMAFAPIIVVGIALYIWHLWRVKSAAPLLEMYFREKCHKGASEQTYAWMNLPAFSADKTSPSWIFDARKYHSQAFEAGEKIKALLQCIKWFGPWHASFIY